MNVDLILHTEKIYIFAHVNNIIAGYTVKIEKQDKRKSCRSNFSGKRRKNY